MGNDQGPASAGQGGAFPASAKVERFAGQSLASYRRPVAQAWQVDLRHRIDQHPEGEVLAQALRFRLGQGRVIGNVSIKQVGHCRQALQ